MKTNTIEQNEKTVERVSDWIDAELEAQLEYSENHIDAGNNYAHLPAEGEFGAFPGDRLPEFIQDNEIDAHGLDIDTLAELCLDSFEMVSRHGFSAPPDHIFSLDSYPISEIEVQIDISTIAECLDIDKSEVIAALESLNKVIHDSGHYGGYILDYAISDCYWSAEIDADQLQESINDYMEVAA